MKRISSDKSAIGRVSLPMSYEGLCIRIGRRLRGQDVVESLRSVIAERGAPPRVFVDNGGEFAGRLMDLAFTVWRAD
jgi:hypothetical protein